MIYRAGQIRPSFQQGFARSRGESAYPELWDGLVGLWVPSLGHQGLTTLKDWSGNDDGTLNGSMNNEDWVLSPYGYALDFDGTDDYVRLGNARNLPLGSSVRTMMIRFKLATVEQDSAMLQYGDNDTAQRSDLFYNYNAGTTRLCFECAGSPLTYFAWTPDLNWHHFTVVVIPPGASDSVEMYIDGVSKSFTAVTPTTLDTSIADISTDFPAIGAIPISGAGVFNPFNGCLDDARIYNRSLSPAEVLASALGASPLTLKRRVYGKAPVAAGARPRLIDGRLVNDGLLLRGIAA